MRSSDWSADVCSSDLRHPYTRGLLSCLPTLDADKHPAPLVPIRGSVTVPRNRPPGCVFATRCEFKREGLCTSDTIPMGLAPDSRRHRVRCARQFELPAPQQPVNPEEAVERSPAAAEPLLDTDAQHGNDSWRDKVTRRD